MFQSSSPQPVALIMSKAPPAHDFNRNVRCHGDWGSEKVGAWEKEVCHLRTPMARISVKRGTVQAGLKGIKEALPASACEKGSCKHRHARPVQLRCPCPALNETEDRDIPACDCQARQYRYQVGFGAAISQGFGNNKDPALAGKYRHVDYDLVDLPTNRRGTPVTDIDST